METILNTDLTEDTDLAFSLIFLVGKWLLDFYQDFRGFASACGTPFFWKASDDILDYITLSYTEKEVPQHLQILLNPNKDPNITDEIISKNYPWKTNPWISVLSVFNFLICGPAEGQGHNFNTE